jgi:uncharacterized protein YuzE
MRLAYDIEADALAITIADGVVDRTVEIEPGTLVDLDADGRVLMIEVIRRSRPWPLAEILARFDLSTEDQVVLTEIASGSPTFDVIPLAPLAVA